MAPIATPKMMVSTLESMRRFIRSRRLDPGPVGQRILRGSKIFAFLSAIFQERRSGERFAASRANFSLASFWRFLLRDSGTMRRMERMKKMWMQRAIQNIVKSWPLFLRIIATSNGPNAIPENRHAWKKPNVTDLFGGAVQSAA